MLQIMSDSDDNGRIDEPDPVAGPSRRRDDVMDDLRDDIDDFSSEYFF